MKKKKVVIQFVEAGMGHIVTAEAIAECLEKKYSDKLEIIRDYVFRDSQDPDLINYEKFSINEVRKANKNKFHLRLQLLMMKIFGARFTLKLSYSTVFKKVRNKLIKHMASQNADMFISTYFMTLHSGVVGKSKKKLNATIVAYNPDHNTHGWWDKKADLFITNNPNATTEAIKIRKMSPDNVATVNFIARQIVLDTNESKAYYRKKYNIPSSKLVVVIADGAYAAARLEEYTDALIQSNKEFTLIPICGKNEKLYQKYCDLKDKTKSNITLIPMPFIAEAPELYKAADVFVTKAGPNAITDCVFMETPILTNFYSGEIEKTSNTLFTETYKCGVYEPNTKKAVELLEKWTIDRTELNEFAKNTTVLNKHKNGAEEIADIIANKLLN
ncbi:MAG: hypothetical protein IJW59_02620 [Clostridia bacterium]|nr:hypothetical protein [Clostridia bacterium]